MNKKRFLSMVLCLSLVLSLFVGFSFSASADDIITHTVQNGEYLFKICKAYGLDYYQCKNAIMLLNGFTSETQLNKLSVGQKIKLPANNAVASTVKTTTTTTVSTSTTTGSTTTTTTTTSVSGTTGAAGVAGSAAAYSPVLYIVPHKIVYGDILDKICSAYGSNYYSYSSMILAMSNITNPASIKTGNIVYVPTLKVPTVGAYYVVISHTVKSGETASTICNSYGMNYAKNKILIDGLNYGKNLNSIYVGQSILIPVPNTAYTSTAPSTTTTSTSSSAATSSTAAAAAAVTQYEITFDYNTSDPWEGTPYALVNGVNVSKAAAGSKVVVNGNSNTSYALKSITVTRSDSSSKTTYQGNSFTMPACGVRIKCNYDIAYAIIKDPSANGTYNVFVNGVSANYALAGDKITFSTAPNSGFVVSKVEYKDGSWKTVSKNYDGVYEFTMPAADTEVKVTFSAQTYYKLTWNNTVFNGSFVVKTNDLVLVNDSSVAEGETITVICSPAATYAAGVSALGLSTNTQQKVTQNGNTFTFKMPAENTQITASFYNNKAYSIKADYSQSPKNSGILRFSVDGHIQNVALAGQTVTVMPEAYGTYKYKEAFVRFAETGAYVDAKQYTDHCTFTMPAADVVVYAKFEDTGSGLAKHTVYKHPESPDNFMVSADGTAATQTVSFAMNEKVYVSPSYDTELWDMVRVEVYNSAKVKIANATNEGGNKFTFLMQNEDVYVKSVRARYDGWATIKLVDHKNADGEVDIKLTASVNGSEVKTGTKVAVGQKITLTATVYGSAQFKGFAEDGVNDLVGTGEYTCTYVVKRAETDTSGTPVITFQIIP